MSELLIGTIKVPTGTTGQSLAGALETGLPDSDGKAESSTGNSLPLPISTKDRDSESIELTLNKMTLSVGRELKFIVDLDSAQPIIQVFNRETGELIRQIPAASVSTYPLKDGMAAIRLHDTFV